MRFLSVGGYACLGFLQGTSNKFCFLSQKEGERGRNIAVHLIPITCNNSHRVSRFSLAQLAHV
jgi:hypothetical protein